MFKLKNQYLSGLVQWLELQELEGKRNRERIRFINLLRTRLKEVQGFLNSLIDKYVQKDEKGHYKVKKEKDNEFFEFETEENKKKYIEEVNDLYNEEFKIELTELNKEMLAVIKDIVLNTNYKFGPKENDTLQEKMTNIRIAYEYNEWAKSFEEIKI